MSRASSLSRLYTFVSISCPAILRPLFLVVYKLAKAIARFVNGGRGELERLLSSGDDPQQLLTGFEDVVTRSRVLRDLATQILDGEGGPVTETSGTSTSTSTTAAAQDGLILLICQRKAISAERPLFHSRVYPNLKALLALTSHASRVEKAAARLASTAYDSTSLHHEAQLDLLWSLAFPETPLPARKGPHWGSLGFQGNDPATDFRGGGLLSLLALQHMARRYPLPMRDILKSTELPFKGYPLAITVIRTTDYALSLLCERRLPLPPPPSSASAPADESSSESESALLEPFLDRVSHMFFLLDDVWHDERASTVMDMPRCFKAFKMRIEGDSYGKSQSQKTGASVRRVGGGGGGAHSQQQHQQHGYNGHSSRLHRASVGGGMGELPSPSPSSSSSASSSASSPSKAGGAGGGGGKKSSGVLAPVTISLPRRLAALATTFTFTVDAAAPTKLIAVAEAPPVDLLASSSPPLENIAPSSSSSSSSSEAQTPSHGTDAAAASEASAAAAAAAAAAAEASAAAAAAAAATAAAAEASAAEAASAAAIAASDFASTTNL